MSERKRRIIQDDDDLITPTTHKHPFSNHHSSSSNSFLDTASFTTSSGTPPPLKRTKRSAGTDLSPNPDPKPSFEEDEEKGDPLPPLLDVSSGSAIPFPADSQDSLHTLIRTFQKDAVLRKLNEHARIIHHLQSERDMLIARNSLLSDSLTAIGGWWTEIADELLLLSGRFDAQQHINDLLSQQDNARSAFLTCLLLVDHEEELEEQLNQTHAQARALVASFIYYIDQKTEPVPPDTEALQGRCVKLRKDLVKAERELVATRNELSASQTKCSQREDDLRRKNRALDRLQSRTWHATFMRPRAPPTHLAPGHDSDSVDPSHGLHASESPALPTTKSILTPEPAASESDAKSCQSVPVVNVLSLDDLAKLADPPAAQHMHAMAEELSRTKRELDAVRVQLQQSTAEIPPSHPVLASLRDELSLRTNEAHALRTQVESLTTELGTQRNLHAEYLKIHQEALASMQASAEAEVKKMVDEIARVRRQRDEAVQQREVLTADQKSRIGMMEAHSVQNEVRARHMKMLESVLARHRAVLAEKVGWTEVARELAMGGDVAELVGKLEKKVRELRASHLPEQPASKITPEVLEVVQLRAELENAQSQVSALCEEMNSMADGYTSLDTRITQVVASLRSREEQVARLAAEKTKLDGKILFLRKQSEQLKAETEVSRRLTDALRETVKVSEERDRVSAQHGIQLTKENQLVMELSGKERAKSQMYEMQVSGYEIKTKSLEEQVGQLVSILDARTMEYEAVRIEVVSLQSKILVLSGLIRERDQVIAQYRPTDELGGPRVAVNGGGVASDADVLLSDHAMLQNYRQLLQCNICRSQFKDTVLTKCMHTFCRGCVDVRIETRQRKCPTCGESFGQGDVRQLFL